MQRVGPTSGSSAKSGGSWLSGSWSARAWTRSSRSRRWQPYAGIGVRKLRDYLDDPAHLLPCYRLGNKTILVRRSEFDAWIAAYRQRGRADVDATVRDVLKGL